MLDFRELPQSGTDLELLIREIFFHLGHRPYWSGVGADGGRDLFVEESRPSVIAPDTRLWLVQCKHFAHSGSSVGAKDLDNIMDSCAQHSAQGYLLVCSTQPTSAVVNRLRSIGATGELATAYWDAVAIERVLGSPQLWPIAQRFFPKSAVEWRVYATDHPNRWTVNYRGYYFHFANRIGSEFAGHFTSIALRIKFIESISLPKNYFFRIRAIYYDDKNGNYLWFLDYMHPQGTGPHCSRERLLEILGDSMTQDDGQVYTYDLVARTYSDVSDHYDPDHYDFYHPYLASFAWGREREHKDWNGA